MPNYQFAAKWLVPNLMGGGQTNEKASPERLACLVDQTPKFSNLLEDIKKVERFAQYIENQASENMEEMEGS